MKSIRKVAGLAVRRMRSVRSPSYCFSTAWSARCGTEAHLETPASTANIVHQVPFHIPVMAQEAIDMLEPKDGQVFIDMTFGAGGHSKRILDAAPNAKIYALDRDPVAFQCAKCLAEQYKGRIIPILGKFSDLDAVLQRHGRQYNSVDGILFDVGVSSMQMDDPLRGFSVNKNGPLDMRMDGSRLPHQVSASQLLKNIDEYNLARILKVYGEEKHAKPIAHALIETKYNLRNIMTTHDLAAVVNEVIDNNSRLDKLRRPAHSATKVFQAIRIFVNNELNELNYGMEVAHSYLRPGGKIVAITFHSLEDRIVKRHFVGIDMDEKISFGISQKYQNSMEWHNSNEIASLYSGHWIPINKKVLLPTEQEVLSNPRSRSAKLRAATKNRNS